MQNPSARFLGPARCRSTPTRQGPAVASGPSDRAGPERQVGLADIFRSLGALAVITGRTGTAPGDKHPSEARGGPWRGRWWLLGPPPFLSLPTRGLDHPVSSSPGGTDAL